jgi:glycosyl transferase family 25
MDIYMINLDRRPDRFEAMTGRAAALGLSLKRVAALDAAEVEPEELDRWFVEGGPLGDVPRGDKACLLSHRLAWERFLASGASHAAFLEDDVVLSQAAGELLASDAWIPGYVAVVKLEHYGPKGQKVLLSGLRQVGNGFQIGRMLSRHTGAAAYILSRRAAEYLLCQPFFALPVDHLLFNPNNSPLVAGLAPQQLVPAIARQEQFVGAQSISDRSDIETTRIQLRSRDWAYVRREVKRFSFDVRLVPQQLAALIKGARLVAMRTAG